MAGLYLKQQGRHWPELVSGGFIPDRTDEHIADMANAFRTHEELAKPPEDLAPLYAEASLLRSKIRKLVMGVEDEQDEGRWQVYQERIDELSGQLKEISQKLAQARVRDLSRPSTLNHDDVRQHVTGLRETLEKGDVAEAAHLIRSMTGRIKIAQRRIEGKRGAQWLAAFKPKTAALLNVESGSSADVNTSVVEVVIEHMPKYEQLAPTVRALIAAAESNGRTASINGIAKALAKP